MPTGPNRVRSHIEPKMEQTDSNEKVPLFLVKLWKIVEDPTFSKIVCWDKTGFSFHILDPYSFCRTVLPQFFKHNNLNSLIRQLNMYGFRKMTPIERTSLTHADSDHEHLEFQHPFFVRGHPELLNQIKRKIAGNTGRPSPGPDMSTTGRNLSAILDEVRQLREKQTNMDGNLGHLMKENNTLWREVSRLRQLHMKQQQVVNKLIQFLISVVQPAGQKRLGKRQLLAIGPDDFANDAKRARPSNLFSNVSMDTLHTLQQELSENNLTNGQQGLTIADVTDELDHGQGTSRNNTFPDSLSFPIPTIPLVGDNVTLANNWPPPTPSPFNLDLSSLNGQGSSVEPQMFSQPSLYSANGNNNGDGNQQMFPPLGQSLPPLDGSPLRPDLSNRIELSSPLFDKYVKPGVPVSTDFSDYLNTVDTSLESCRDVLSGGGYNFDTDQLQDIFNMCEQSDLTDHTNTSHIVGNEVTLYQPPNIDAPLDQFPDQQFTVQSPPDSVNNEAYQAAKVVEDMNRKSESPEIPSALVTPLVSPIWNGPQK